MARGQTSTAPSPANSARSPTTGSATDRHDAGSTRPLAPETRRDPARDKTAQHLGRLGLDRSPSGLLGNEEVARPERFPRHIPCGHLPSHRERYPPRRFVKPPISRTANEYRPAAAAIQAECPIEPVRLLLEAGDGPNANRTRWHPVPARHPRGRAGAATACGGSSARDYVPCALGAGREGPSTAATPPTRRVRSLLGKAISTRGTGDFSSGSFGGARPDQHGPDRAAPTFQAATPAPRMRAGGADRQGHLRTDPSPCRAAESRELGRGLRNPVTMCSARSHERFAV